MRVLVTGGSGFVGWYVVQRFRDASHTIGYTYYQTPPKHQYTDVFGFQVDIRDRLAVRNVVRWFNPDTVVHAAAISDADVCERDPEMARAVNVEGTQHVTEACEQVNARLAFLSTSFVFGGGKGPYSEDDEPSPINVYGQTKLNAEGIIEAADVPHIVARIDQPYAWLQPWREHTFVEWVLDCCAANEPFPVFDNWHNTPIYIPDIVEVLRKLFDRQITGTFHIVGPNYVSRFEWAQLVADIFGYDQSLVRPGDSGEADLPATRPSTHLSNERVRAATSHRFCTLHEGLSEMRAEQAD